MPIDTKRLRILHYPAKVLQTKAAAIESITDEVRAVADRMVELMYEAEGIGLAAPQVGLPWRLFVTAGREEEPDRVFINPELRDFSDDLIASEEGCLSLPNITVEVRRPRTVTIEARDLEGEIFCLTGEELRARVWQHEFDHIEGILIINRMGPMDRLANRRALRDLEAAAE